jgi:hypothetical protein
MLQDRINRVRANSGGTIEPESSGVLRNHPLVCDNKSIVNKINEIIQYDKVYPNVTMASEWDVLAEIRAAMLELTAEGQPTISHIKGHQDRKTPFAKLPLKAQLNCRADWLAEEYLTENPTLDHSRVPILPTSGCQLFLSHGTVTHNIKQEVKNARAAPPLKARLCRRHDWSDDEFEDIDWQLHGQALNQLQRHKKTLVQYLHDWLPVGKKVHQYDKKYPESCPSCQAPVEDREHLWECRAPCRSQWRRECLSTLLKTLTAIDTAPPLQELLLEAFRALMEGRSMTTIRVDPAVADVAAAQAAIGWHHILKGRFSKRWRITQDRYLRSKATNENNGSTWLTKIIKVWFLEWLRLWKLRNEDRHGRDRVTWLQAEERQP